MFIRKRFIVLIVVVVIVAFIEALFFYRQYQSLPEFALPLLNNIQEPTKADRVLVFAPHCDDETLGAGGYIAKAVQNQANVEVVMVTNGDGHRFSTIEEFKKLYPTSQDYINSGYKRQDESKRALATLGLTKNIIFLGYPDGGIGSLFNRNWQSTYRSPFTKTGTSPYQDNFRDGVTYQGVNLYNDIVKILTDFNPTVVIFPSADDAHPDHKATNWFVEKALTDNPSLKVQKYYYLVHYRRFPNPGGLHLDRYLMPPANLINLGTVWGKFDMDQSLQALKVKAIKQYTSQIAVPTLRTLMEGFMRQNELFSAPK
jgi:LmbE family N-acetylglucosaminyl deacetylase